jgi:mono/diheme cytochrome c family protein
MRGLSAIRIVVLAGIAAIAVTSISAPSVAQDTRAIQAQFGRQTYRLFCVGCHGADGRGEGDVAHAMNMEVGDLTTLAARNGGVFPADEIAAAISGESEVLGHKKLAMEPWAKVFAEEFHKFAERRAVKDLVRRRIDHIVAYLESIQR